MIYNSYSSLSKSMVLSCISIFLFLSGLVYTSSGYDSDAMLKLASALTPTPSSWSRSINGQADYCSWNGITCNSLNRVITINLANKNLSGILPSELSTLSQLQSLSLEQNQLYGPLPSLANLSLLEELYLGANKFTEIPRGFFQGLTKLRIFIISWNSNLAPWSLPIDLSQCMSLETFRASETNLMGNIPDIFSSLISLRELDLSYNNLKGTLPASFAKSGIQNLWLNYQQERLSGTILVLSSMTQLRQLWLHNNQFTGPIPDLSKCQGLFDLQLRNNLLTGLVPPSLVSLPTLQNVSLSYNMLQGPVPVFPSNVNAEISVNNFCVKIAGIPCDPQVSVMLRIASALGYPVLLSTSWPGNDACDWKFVTCNAQNRIITVNMGKLNLSGSIDPEFANLTSLTHLLLDDNSLTGSIPESLTNLTQLQVLDVSNNNLTGGIPSFPSPVKLITEGNPLLGMDSSSGSGWVSDSGSNFSTTSSKDEKSKGKSNGHNKGLPFIIGGVIFVVICLIIMSFVQIKNNFKKRHQNSEGVEDYADVHEALSEIYRNGNCGDHKKAMISVEVLRQATGGFDEINILGEGGFGVVYKGELHAGIKIAVKRMANKTMDPNETNGFQAEIEVLTRVRHKHLVAFLGYCINGNEKFLVYEYMPQGTLAQHLFEWRERGFPPLTWKQRVTIALDVARGVEYLHSLAQQSFIHRDLKSANILLGDDMRAKVADFSLVKNVPNGKNSLQTRVAGTFGYLAPEYASTGKVTRKVDVYAFGAILMEMITGRKALDEKVGDEGWMLMHLVTWFREMENKEEEILKTIDETLNSDEETRMSIFKVAELAGHCTAPESQQRPDMCYIVNILGPLIEQWKPPIKE